MTDYEDDIDDRDLALGLRRLAADTVVPPIDPQREAALMAAFDAAQLLRTAPRTGRVAYWGMAGLATAATLLIAVGLAPVRGARHRAQSPATVRDLPGDQPPAREFVLVPGAASLPRMESGSLVRMDVPVSMLPSLGITPPADRMAKVRADVIVGQDGLARAVRLVD